MKKVIVEPQPEGAIYALQKMEPFCPWGSVLAWALLPFRPGVAGQPSWQFEPGPNQVQ